MNRNRRTLRWNWLTMAAVLAVASLGCGDASSNGAASLDNGPNFGGGGSTSDAGSGGTAGVEGANGVDGLFDNPVDLLFADAQRNPGDFLGPSTDATGDAQGYSEAALACYASANTCAESECGAFASCCVNTGACCMPVGDGAPLPATLDFRACNGQDVFGCAETSLANAVTFGELEPVLNARGLVPNGTAEAEGGVVIGEPVNLPAQRVELDVQFSLPIACSGTCLESAGVAFTATEPGAFVDAGVGLLLSGSREVVNVMIGNEVADSFPAAPGNTKWRMVLSPGGSAQVFRNEELRGRYAFDAASLSRARLVAFGRNLSEPSDSAAIAAIQVQLAHCDNPRAWNERQPARVSIGVNDSPRHAFGAGPSLVDLPQSRQVAFELDGEIYVGEQRTPGEVFVEEPAPALLPTEPHEAMGLSDPELVFDGSNVFLFYTARDGSGAGSIAVAVSDESLTQFSKAGAPVLVATDEVVSYDAPTVVFRDGLWLLVVRASLSSGMTELRAFYTSNLDTGWARVVNGGLEQRTRAESPTSDITEPSLLIHNSAYQLYYARRSGTRWSVELLVSDELLFWRALGDVLGGSDEAFDSLGARSPDAVSGPDRIDIVYSGQDGVAFQLGTASRTAPSNTASSIF